MKTMSNYITMRGLGRVGAVVILTAAIGLVGCKSTDRTTGQKWSDHQVAKAVEKGLKKDTTFKYHDVQPVVYNGTVQLTGFVETEEQRLRAADIASRAKGAHQVINQIMLKPATTGAANIRDPLAHDTGHLLMDTNAPVMHMRNLTPGEGTTPETK